MDQKVIDFLKGLMQPMFSVLAAFIVVRLLLTGFDQSLLFWLAAGVLGFWFGKTIGLFGDAKVQSTAATQEKTDLIQTVAAQSQDLATSVPAPVVNAIMEKLNTPIVTATTNSGSTAAAQPSTGDPDPDAYLKEIS
jgi:hypothetical protein